MDVASRLLILIDTIIQHHTADLAVLIPRYVAGSSFQYSRVFATDLAWIKAPNKFVKILFSHRGAE